MNQRRKPSPAVYRRRRLVAALLAVFLLALLVWGAQALFGAVFDDDGADEASEPSTESEPEDTEEAEEPAPPEEDEEGSSPEPDPEVTEEEDEEEDEGYCPASDVIVRAGTSSESYPADTAAMLIMEIENTGSSDCTLDVGTAEQVFSVSQGGREVFTTNQCELNGESLEMEFEPGQTERAQMVWPRSDSSVDCTEAADLPSGEYELTVSVSGISSEPHTFHLDGAAE